MMILLPFYTGERTGARWLRWFRWVALIVAALLLGASIGVRLSDETFGRQVVDVATRVTMAVVITLSVVPFFGRAPAAESIPPRMYRLAGIISTLFSVALVLPVSLAWWGIDLRLDDALLYLAFYALLSIRFLLLLIPRMRRVAAGDRDRRQQKLEQFAISERERDVYDLLAKGYTYKEIARLLRISLSTVKTHVDHLFRKTGTTNKVELINEIGA
jgi:DNA-binding CsgD family transcriptional regulator